MIVHLPSIRPPKGRYDGRLQPEHSAAHAQTCLPLLPSGPDGVRAPNIAQGPTINTARRSTLLKRPYLGQEFDPAIADCGLQGTASSPSSTITHYKGYSKSQEIASTEIPKILCGVFV